MDRKKYMEGNEKNYAEARGWRKQKYFPIICAICLRGVFMNRKKDLVRLADYLGHSSIETTRRYTMLTSEEVCKKSLELDLFSEKTGGEYERHNMYYVVRSLLLFFR